MEFTSAAFTVCRLRAGRAELAQRFLGRGGQADMLEEVLSAADAIDASDFAYVCVDTGGLPARQTRDAAAGGLGWAAAIEVARLAADSEISGRWVGGDVAITTTADNAHPGAGAGSKW
jgi:hypothetical protein